MSESASPIFDYAETLLSPKDLHLHLSMRIRVGLFVTAWLSVLWFLLAPFVDSVRVGYGLSLLVFQIWWLYLMLWVIRWACAGAVACRRHLDNALAALRQPPADGGYKTPDVIHWVILPNYREDVHLLRATLNALAMQTVGARRICVVLAAEDAEPGSLAKLAPLVAEYPEFRKLVINVHTLAEGEVAGKSSNVSAAFRALCAAVYRTTKDARLGRIARELETAGTRWHESPDARANDPTPYQMALERGVITVIDADSILHPFHLAELEQSYHFSDHHRRDSCIWQAPIANLLNASRVPAASRLASIIVSLHELAVVVHPSAQKLPFSTYSMTVRLALQMGGWASDVIAEDEHAYLRAWFSRRGDCHIVPLHYPVVCTSVEAPTYIGSLVARFTQARRHAWGVIEAACAYGLWHDCEWYRRPLLLDAAHLLWTLFSLHYVTLFQPVMLIGSIVFHSRLLAEGFGQLPHDRIDESTYRDALWLIVSATSVLTLALPLLTVASYWVTQHYEALLRAQHIEALAWAPLDGLARRLGCKYTPPTPGEWTPLPREMSDYLAANLVVPRSTLVQRALLLIEFVVVMPVTCLVYGFVPALLAQSTLPFTKHYNYVVAAKPNRGASGINLV